MHHRGVVTTAKHLADGRQALLGKVFGQGHGHLARAGDGAGALFADQIGDFQLVEVGHGFHDVFNRDLALCFNQNVL